ncbi:MAG: LTA synthase family protein [Candidatus Pacearchaeota archaeon]
MKKIKKKEGNKIVRFLVDPLFLFITFLLLNVLKSIFFYTTISFSNGTTEIFIFNIATTIFFTVLFYYLIIELSKRTNPFVFIVAYIIQAIYLIVNFLYFLHFNDYLYLDQAFLMIFEGFESIRAGSMNFYPIVLIMIIDLPILIAVFLKIKKIDSKKAFRITALILFICFIIILVSYFSIYDRSNYYSYGDAKFATMYGVPALQIRDLINKVGMNLANSLVYSNNTISQTKSSEKKSILLIQVESLDANAIFADYNGKPVMPFLRELALKSVYYPYALSHHYEGTADSEFSVLNSVDPLKDYPAIKLRNYDYPNSVVKVFKAANYSALVFHGNRGEFWNRNKAMYAMGFYEFYDFEKFGVKEITWGAKDDEVFSFVLEKINNETNPFFYYVITMGSHMPYTFVLPYYNITDYDGIQDIKTRNYFISLSYVDNSLKNFIEELEKSEKFKNLYIIIFGDHYEYGILYNLQNDSFHGASIRIYNDCDCDIGFVPIFIITPDKKQYIEEKYAASFLDIAPTVLLVSGISFFNYSTEGQNLVDFPIKDSAISFIGNQYRRAVLYQMAKATINNKYMHDFISERKIGLTGRAISIIEGFDYKEKIIKIITRIFLKLYPLTHQFL